MAIYMILKCCVGLLVFIDVSESYVMFKVKPPTPKSISKNKDIDDIIEKLLQSDKFDAIADIIADKAARKIRELKKLDKEHKAMEKNLRAKPDEKPKELDKRFKVQNSKTTTNSITLSSKNYKLKDSAILHNEEAESEELSLKFKRFTKKYDPTTDSVVPDDKSKQVSKRTKHIKKPEKTTKQNKQSISTKEPDEDNNIISDEDTQLNLSAENEKFVSNEIRNHNPKKNFNESKTNGDNKINKTNISHENETGTLEDQAIKGGRDKNQDETAEQLDESSQDKGDENKTKTGLNDTVSQEDTGSRQATGSHVSGNDDNDNSQEVEAENPEKVSQSVEHNQEGAVNQTSGEKPEGNRDESNSDENKDAEKGRKSKKLEPVFRTEGNKTYTHVQSSEYEEYQEQLRKAMEMENSNF